MTNSAPGERPDGITPSQTVGPFFAYALSPTGRYNISDLTTNDLVTEDAAGTRIRIEGRIVDGDGLPVADALLEIWQADGEGRFAGHDPALSNARFKGFGRCETDANGRFSFHTVKPGSVRSASGTQAPHINVGIFARGLLLRLFTRLYFADEGANAEDAVLALVPQDRRSTLLAQRDDAQSEPTYRFDIRLQGDGETVFFEA